MFNKESLVKMDFLSYNNNNLYQFIMHFVKLCALNLLTSSIIYICLDNHFLIILKLISDANSVYKKNIVQTYVKMSCYFTFKSASDAISIRFVNN